jgi:hypothetical protein
MRKIAAGLQLTLVNATAVFTGDALARPVGDLTGNLPVLGEVASVLPVAGGTGAELGHGQRHAGGRVGDRRDRRSGNLLTPRPVSV